MAGFRVLETVWIPLADGVRLAARIWLPDGAIERPVPAVLEFLPYRRRDGTARRDESTYPVYARAGVAGVRVDQRGSGDSDGLPQDEYAPRELADATEVIAWIAAQPWCSGAVGMQGISWGGFNALQVAALRPPALKAVISLASTVDRFDDDIHYKGGCHLGANFSWAATMLSYASRPADPAVRPDWRERWLERLEAITPPLETWLGHQRRDAYWRHGSICEDYRALTTPALVIGGWADGYRNAATACATGLAVPTRAILGPWIHKYPHFAWPKPRIDFHGEAIRWWRQWLEGAKTDALEAPLLRAFMTEGVRPGDVRERDAGRWIGVDAIEDGPRLVMGLRTDGRLEREPGDAGARAVCTPFDVGVACGEYFPLTPGADIAGDQAADDARSTLWETPPLAEPLEVLGRPVLRLRLRCDAPRADVIARLVDVHPDGVAHRVSIGCLNLAHRYDRERPQPMPAGASETVTIRLDDCAHRFRAGHRLRLALSTAYWPYILPGAFHATVTVDTGAASTLDLPLLGAHRDLDWPEPTDPKPLPEYPQLTPAEASRRVIHDLETGETLYEILDDSGESEHPTLGGVSHEVRRERYRIRAGDPVSWRCEAANTAIRRRDGLVLRTEATTTLAPTETAYRLGARLEAFVGAERVFRREWTCEIARDHT